MRLTIRPRAIERVQHSWWKESSREKSARVSTTKSKSRTYSRPIVLGLTVVVNRSSHGNDLWLLRRLLRSEAESE